MVKKNYGPINDCCPNCGACQHCGRGGRQSYPVYPYQPWQPYVYPTYPYQPYVSPTWIGDNITISDATDWNNDLTITYTSKIIDGPQISM